MHHREYIDVYKAEQSRERVASTAINYVKANEALAMGLYRSLAYEVFYCSHSNYGNIKRRFGPVPPPTLLLAAGLVR